MKSRAEYQKRKIKSQIDAYFSWAGLSEEGRAWYASLGMTQDAYIGKCSRIIRHMDRAYQYVKKHGVIVNGKRIRKGELSE